MSGNKRIIIIGNWKMHLTAQEASLLVKRLDDRVESHRDVEVVLAPSMMTLQPMSVQIDKRKFKLAAQNAYFVDEGAYTGEVSFTMLRGVADYCLVGHSERRIYFHESLEMIRDKVQAAVRNGIKPILCIGETKHERAAGETKRVLHDQLTTALSNLTEDEVSEVVIAYEPVWAISTFGGKQPAKPDEIETAIKWIRHLLEELYGAEKAEAMRVIYGASVDAEFVGNILNLPGVDGLLPGAASLNYHKFADIVNNAYKVVHDRETDDGGK
ncbi:MAG TPA: triose-phosphate isomerase [Candidatus Saccharimonadales bacterium]|nr:triose-phosphate isomerase [Candidatus Saccharimonadales bacterium]